MHAYAILLRGINVGGKNKVPMAGLRAFLSDIGCSDVATYIQSGNAIVRSPLTAKTLRRRIESGLPKAFRLDSATIKALVLDRKTFSSIVVNIPKGFGDSPDTYHCDVIFLIDLSAKEAMRAFSPKEGVDTVWKGRGAIYSQRLSAKRTNSRLSKVMGSPAYKSMTIRNWATTTTLAAMLKEAARR